MHQERCETYICQVVDRPLPALKQFRAKSLHHFVGQHPTDRQLRQELEQNTTRRDDGTTVRRMIVRIFYRTTAASPPEPNRIRR